MELMTNSAFFRVPLPRCCLAPFKSAVFGVHSESQARVHYQAPHTGSRPTGKDLSAPPTALKTSPALRKSYPKPQWGPRPPKRARVAPRPQPGQGLPLPPPPSPPRSLKPIRAASPTATGPAEPPALTLMPGMASCKPPRPFVLRPPQPAKPHIYACKRVARPGAKESST